ncbi:MAG: tetratricopeptide repeat protein [candidate division WOR-3 bacterium]
MKIFKIYFSLFLIASFIGCAGSGVKEEVKEKEPTQETKEISEAERYYSFAYEYMKQKNYEKAISLLEKSIGADSSYIEAYLALRQVYIELGDTPKALEICKKALRCTSDQEKRRKVILAIASIYGKLGEPQKAEQLFLDVIRDKPNDANGYDLYASYLESQGRIQEAIQNYKKAYEYAPNNGGIAFRLGNAYFESGDYAKAVEFLKKAKDFFGNDIDVIKRLGEAYTELGEYSKAIEEYNSILKMIPKHVSSRLNIGNVYLKMKQYGKAESYYKEALEIEPDNLSVYYQLINLELLRDNLPGVKKYIDRAFSIDSDDEILLALYGEYYYRVGLKYMGDKKWNPAIEQFESSIRIWQKVRVKSTDPKWVSYAKEGIARAEKNIEEIKKVRW